MTNKIIPKFVAVSPGRFVEASKDFARWLENVASWGVDAVQIRVKEGSDREKLKMCQLARKVLPGDCSLFVNARPDIALSSGAEGVHLPADGLPTRRVKETFGDRLLVGRSTHSLGEVERARDEDADFVFFGPVYPTPSKVQYGEALGLDRLSSVSELGIPVIAIGGMTLERLPAVLTTGARGFAAIRMFERAGAPEELAQARKSPRKHERIRA